MIANTQPEKQVSGLLSAISQPGRIQILFILAGQESCVCHIEAITGMRQAGISQHLIALRNAGLVESRREGRNIYYSLSRSDVLEVLWQAARVCGIEPKVFSTLTQKPVPGCSCPQCNPGVEPNLTCPKVRNTKSS